MRTCILQTPIPLARVAMLQRYIRQLEAMGAPVERLLAGAGIAVELLDCPAAATPLENGYRFLELACRTQGSEHLGLHVGLGTSLNDFGPYGHILQAALTLHDYLRRGIARYNLVVSGQRIWLSEHGDELRLNIAAVGESKLGAYQSHLETVIVTIAQFRRAAGPLWSPREIGLAYRSREALPPIDHFAGSRIVRGTTETYLTIPRALLGLRYQGGSAGGAQPTDAISPAARPLPEDLASLVQLQIETLLPSRVVQVDTVAETLGMSARSLQRALTRQGLTYSKLLGEARVRQAARWLEGSDKPVAEIAFDLGYADAANFTRAFRRQTGVPPQTFRAHARKTRAA